MSATSRLSRRNLSCVLIVAMFGLILTAAPIVGATTPITLDSLSTTDNQGGGSANTLSWPHTVTSGASILIVWLSENSIVNPPTVTSVTFGGKSLNPIGREDGALGIQSTHIELWSLLNPPASTATVTLMLSAAETAVVAGAASYFNVIGTTTFTGSNDQSGTVTTPRITVPAVSGQLVIDVLATCSTFCGNSATAPTPGTGSSTFVSSEIHSELFAATSAAPAASPVTLSWVYTSSSWAMGGVALDPSAAIPEYPFGLAILSIIMVLAYAVIKRRTRNAKI
jgi:hypothetical protein